jgi:hypothetical protein
MSGSFFGFAENLPLTGFGWRINFFDYYLDKRRLSTEEWGINYFWATPLTSGRQIDPPFCFLAITSLSWASMFVLPITF